MKTTVDIPDELARKAEAVAGTRGLSLTQWLAEILNRELAQALPPEMVEQPTSAQTFSEDLERLATLVGEHWQGEQDAVSAMREERPGSG